VTRGLYGSGILTWIVYGDLIGLQNHERLPAPSHEALLGWIVSMAGSYAAGTISSYLTGVRVWHQVWSMPWPGRDDELNRAVRGSKQHVPESSVRVKRAPYTVTMLQQCLKYMDLDLHLDAAVWAAMCTAFWGLARLGEITVPALYRFNQAEHASRANLSDTVEPRSGLTIQQAWLPRTKGAPQGEPIYWAKQPESGICPKLAMENHLRVNPCGSKVETNTPLLAHYHSDGKLRPLTKRAFVDRIKDIQKAARRAKDPLVLPTGHTFRIGGTLEYLLRGLDFTTVKVKGRWGSNAFEAYLRFHAEIMAPYMQEKPELHARFVRTFLVRPPRAANSH
jgi:hypothetical protein